MNQITCDWAANRGNPKGQIVLVLFRSAHWVRSLPSPWWLLGAPYLAFYRLMVEWFLGIELRFKTAVGPGLRLYHGQGLVVHERTIIGANCTLRHGTTIGNKSAADSACPVLGNDVDVGAQAIILGAVRIGDGAVIGAGAVVVKDVPPGVTVVGNPARALA
ncbi:MAG TPA: DapH/DapD/GlmU-related protein [Chthoniobacteraceae bacterium]|nr:DapH/DapD/GlmU-related protein [Chthoniobacteraceae bacterium]